MVRLGVGHGRLQHLLQLVGGLARSEGEDGTGLGHAAPADVLRDESRLPRRHAHVLRLCAHFAWCLDGAHQVFLFTSVLRSPECARNVRVGANSPSLWPTICSEMNTGTCLRPSCTAIVCPTISGKTVDVRDQVRIIRFSFFSFIDSMRLISRSSTKGPFLLLRLIYFLFSFPRLRLRTISLFDSLCLRRVRLPSVGTPQGVTGCRPPFDFPSP